MPSKGTTARAIRLSDELWEAALAVARARDETVAGVIRAFLEEYVTLHSPDAEN